MWDEVAAGFEEVGAEGYVAVYVFGLQARALGGEAVGEAQDGEFFAEGARGPGETVGGVVRAGVPHEAYLEVQRRKGCREVRLFCAEVQAPAYAPDQGCAYRVVGDEEDAAFEFAPGYGLGDVVQEGGEAQAIEAVSRNVGAEAVLREFLLHASDHLEDVIQGVQVVVRATLQAAGQGELGDPVEKLGWVHRGFERVEEGLSRVQRYRLRRVLRRLVFGLGLPRSALGASGSPSGRAGLADWFFLDCSMRRCLLRSTKA